MLPLPEREILLTWPIPPQICALHSKFLFSHEFNHSDFDHSDSERTVWKSYVCLYEPLQVRRRQGFRIASVGPYECTNHHLSSRNGLYCIQSKTDQSFGVSIERSNAVPKSASLTCPSTEINTLAGFKSR